MCLHTVAAAALTLVTVLSLAVTLQTAEGSVCV